ncbi:12931_t:CDS:1, partial [Acaulospora colombiana]
MNSSSFFITSNSTISLISRSPDDDDDVEDLRSSNFLLTSR